MQRPVIGICSALEQAQWSVWDRQAALLPYNYIEAIQRAGGIVLMLPPDRALEEDSSGELLDLLDGLILAGGADVDPSFYGAPADAHTLDVVPARDRFEIALTRAAVERDLPVLGICRGMQLINVALGGTLIQHLPDHLGHSHHRRQVGVFEGNEHEVRITLDSLLGRAIGEHIHATKSHHHQGIDRLGRGLRVVSWSVLDDLPEAIELSGRRFVVGVQWHPEADEHGPVIGALVEAARERA